jgi:hypothetical protein
VAPLSREVGEGLPEVREFWWDLSLGRDRGVGAGFIQLAAHRAAGAHRILLWPVEDELSQLATFQERAKT